MRDIFFRGKRVNNGVWIYGFVVLTENGKAYIIPESWGRRKYEVIPSSVGQFTGLLDRNGVRIFEWDKVMNEEGQTLVVMYFQNSFSMRKEDGTSVKSHVGTMEWFFNVEVTGNIHEGGKP
jgi:hypothetical protein